MRKSAVSYSGVGRGGFTLVELLVAMAVTGVVMASVATLAYAMGSVNDLADDTSQTQARLRYASLRIGELLKHCKLICPAAGGDLALWRADENDDNSINPNELVYIEFGENGDYLRLLKFTTADSLKILLADISGGSAKTSLTANYGPEWTVLISNCSNARFYPAGITAESRFAAVLFDMPERDGLVSYQITAALRGWAGNLLDSGGGSLVSDDD